MISKVERFSVVKQYRPDRTTSCEQCGQHNPVLFNPVFINLEQVIFSRI